MPPDWVPIVPFLYKHPLHTTSDLLPVSHPFFYSFLSCFSGIPVVISVSIHYRPLCCTQRHVSSAKRSLFCLMRPQLPIQSAQPADAGAHLFCLHLSSPPCTLRERSLWLGAVSFVWVHRALMLTASVRCLSWAPCSFRKAIDSTAFQMWQGDILALCSPLRPLLIFLTHPVEPLSKPTPGSLPLFLFVLFVFLVGAPISVNPCSNCKM